MTAATLGGWRFRPGAPLTVLAGMALVVLLGLGFWQLQRLSWKTALIREMEAGLAAPPLELAAAPADEGALAYRRARVRGVLRGELSFAFGLRREQGRPGYKLITPLELDGGVYLLVDRGWFPDTTPPDRLPARFRTQAPARLEGVLVPLAPFRPASFTPSPDQAARRLYALDRASLQGWLGISLLPVLLMAEQSEPEDLLGVARVELRLPENPHLGYAITWFGLAGALGVFYVLMGLRRGEAAS